MDTEEDNFRPYEYFYFWYTKTYWNRKYKDTYKILYNCEKYHINHKNIIIKDNDMNEIINISKINKNISHSIPIVHTD